MRLADFILGNIEPIMVEWEAFARRIWPTFGGGTPANPAEVRDHAVLILRSLALDMKTPQSGEERSEKSQGNGGSEKASEIVDECAIEHGADRTVSGFSLAAIASEYRSLRATVVKLWRATNPSPDARDIDDLTRFNEAIDQSLTAAAEGFTQESDRMAAGLRESEQRLRSTFEQTLAGFAEVDLDGRFVKVNARYAEIVGRTPEELCGGGGAVPMRMQDLTHPDDLPGNAELFRRLAEGTGPAFVIEKRYLRPDGSHVWVSNSVSALKDDHGATRSIVAAVLDITDRKQTEDALRQSEQRKTAILESALDCIITINHESRIVEFNASAERAFGYTRAEVIGRGLAECIIPAPYREAHAKGMARYLATGHGPILNHRVELTALRSDGTEFPVELTVSHVKGVEPAQFTAFLRDVTQRKRTEQALEAQKRLHQSVTDNATTALFIMDDRQCCVFMNPAAEELTGFTFDEVRARGGALHDIIHHTRPDGSAYPLSECPIDQALPTSHQAKGEEIFVHKDGRFYDVGFTASPLLDASGTAVGTVIEAQDITERKRVEAELARHRNYLDLMVRERTLALEESQGHLRRSERLAAMGTLAAGMGHDLANLMMPLGLRLDALAKESLSPSAREDLEGVAGALKYLRALSAGLRQLAADPTAPPPSEGIDVAGWWDEARGVVRGVLPRHVQLAAQVPEGLPRVRAHRAGLTQAIFNLVQNASEALADAPAGTIRIDAMLAAPDDKCCPGGVLLIVADDGPGMTPEVAARCFEPYFSTKGRAVSTGMGLALVRGIADHAGGMVEVSSRPGVGTVFTLHLPPVTGARGGAAHVEVEDREAIRAVVDIRDARLAALLGVFMGPLRIEGRPGDSSPPTDAALWITDARPAAHLEAFIRGDGNDGEPTSAPARVVLLMADPDPTAAEPGESVPAARIVHAGASPAMAAVRESIQKAVALVRASARTGP